MAGQTQAKQARPLCMPRQWTVKQQALLRAPTDRAALFDKYWPAPLLFPTQDLRARAIAGAGRDRIIEHSSVANGHVWNGRLRLRGLNGRRRWPCERLNRTPPYKSLEFFRPRRSPRTLCRSLCLLQAEQRCLICRRWWRGGVIEPAGICMRCLANVWPSRVDQPRGNATVDWRVQLSLQVSAPPRPLCGDCATREAVSGAVGTESSSRGMPDDNSGRLKQQ